MYQIIASVLGKLLQNGQQKQQQLQQSLANNGMQVVGGNMPVQTFNTPTAKVNDSSALSTVLSMVGSKGGSKPSGSLGTSAANSVSNIPNTSLAGQAANTLSNSAVAEYLKKLGWK
jgi:hypothetical protein